MIRDNLKNSVIRKYVQHRFADCNIKLVDLCIQKISKRYFPDRKPTEDLNTIPGFDTKSIVAISRSKIFQYILTIDPEAKKDLKIDQYMPAILEAFPILTDIEQIFKFFHSIIMGNDITKLDDFIKEFQGSRLDSFCNGLKKDEKAVKNAIIYDVSSGFVEGNNNKFKAIKRASYGRNKLNSLEKKNLVAFAVTKIENFGIKPLIFEGKTAGCRLRHNTRT